MYGWTELNIAYDFWALVLVNEFGVQNEFFSVASPKWVHSCNSPSKTLKTILVAVETLSKVEVITYP